MGVQDKLQLNFREYILFFYRNPEIQQFSNQGLFHVPTEVGIKLRTSYLNREMGYRKSIEEVFAQGIKQGIIRKGNPAALVWTFKAMRDGSLGWICASPELTEQSIEEFWNGYWLGISARTEE